MGYFAMLFGLGWIALGVFFIRTVYTDWQLVIVLVCFAAGTILLFVGGGLVELHKLIKAKHVDKDELTH